MRIKRYLKTKYGAVFRPKLGIEYACIYLGDDTDLNYLKRKRDRIWKDVSRKFPRQSKYLRGIYYCLTDSNHITFQLTGDKSYTDLLRHELEEYEDEYPNIKTLINRHGIYWINHDDIAILLIELKDMEWEKYVRVLILVSTFNTIDGNIVKGMLMYNHDLIRSIPLTWLTCIIGGHL